MAARNCTAVCRLSYQTASQLITIPMDRWPTVLREIHHTCSPIQHPPFPTTFTVETLAHRIRYILSIQDFESVVQRGLDSSQI